MADLKSMVLVLNFSSLMFSTFQHSNTLPPKEKDYARVTVTS